MWKRVRDRAYLQNFYRYNNAIFADTSFFFNFGVSQTDEEFQTNP